MAREGDFCARSPLNDRRARSEFGGSHSGFASRQQWDDARARAAILQTQAEARAGAAGMQRGIAARAGAARSLGGFGAIDRAAAMHQGTDPKGGCHNRSIKRKMAMTMRGRPHSLGSQQHR